MDLLSKNDPLPYTQSEVYDARFQHPFTFLIAGPSRAGKSTWVYNLLSQDDKYVSVVFDSITIFLGTKIEENTLFQHFQKESPSKVKLIELLELYPSKDDRKTIFPKVFMEYLKTELKGKTSVLVFDDLMGELADTSLLGQLFTKISAHHEISIMHITQNPFHKAGGNSDHVTVLRNAHHLVIFDNPMDSGILVNIARKKAVASFKKLAQALLQICKKYRYVVITGTFDCPTELQFRSCIFNTEPCTHQLAFAIDY